MSIVYKADVQAAERLLKAAVRRAVEMTAEGITGRYFDTPTGGGWISRDHDPEAIVAMLTAATHAADLLLTTAPAKKAAARKGAS